MPKRPARNKPHSLQQELKQRRPFRSPGHEALLDVAHTADVLVRAFAHLVRPWGITPQQYNVLRILRGAGGDGLPTLEIADRMVERTPGITRLIDRLERGGWVVRVRSSADRRQVHCRATPSGVALLAKLDPVVERYENGVLSSLTTAQHVALVKLLDALRAAVR